MQKRPITMDKEVYVRAVRVNELPKEVQEELSGTELAYLIVNQKGEELALVKGEALAFDVARYNDYDPYRLH